MCYLVAKNIDSEGCVALRTTHGKHLSEFKRSIEKRLDMIKFSLLQLADHQHMENMSHIILSIQNKNLSVQLNKCSQKTYAN